MFKYRAMRSRLLLFLMALTFAVCFPSLRAVFDTGALQPRDPKRETYLFLKGRIRADDEALIELARLIHEESSRNHIDYRLVLAMIKVESNFDTRAISEMGARGLLQIKPSLARFLIKELELEWKGPHTLHDPEKNIKIGIRFISSLTKEFGSLEKALLAYNLGPTRLREIMEEGRTPDKSFARRVMREYKKNILILPASEQ